MVKKFLNIISTVGGSEKTPMGHVFFLTKNISCDIFFKGPTPPVVFPKMHLLERRWSPVLFVTFNIVISFIFPKIFIEVPQVVQKIWRFSPSILSIFTDFSDFLSFPSYKETKHYSIEQMMSAFFYFQPILNRLVNNFIKFYWY